MTSSEEFRKFGTAMINYVADYLDNIRDRPVVPEVIKHFPSEIINSSPEAGSAYLARF